MSASTSNQPVSSLAFRTIRAVRSWLRLDRERRWNRQYADGGWECLRNLDELAHHAVLAGYFARLKSGGSLLDVGCGEGIFHEQLRGCYSSYLGIDFNAPVRQAQSKVNERTRFEVADMNDFATTERFDAIVFNESLYYHHAPRAAIAQYAQMLAPEGVFLISMNCKPKNDELWELFDERFVVLDAMTMHNTRGTQWTTKALGRSVSDRANVSR